MDKLLALGRAQAPTCPALRRQAHNSTPRAHVRHRSTISSSRRTWVSRHRVQAMERGGERPATALGPPSPATVVVEEGPKSTAAASVSTLINVAVGAGVLSMPFATEKVGLGLGVALTVLVASVEAYTLCVLTQFAEQTGATSYSSLVRRVLGDQAAMALSLLLYVYLLLSCTAYVMIAADCLCPLLGAALGSDSWLAARQVVVAAVGLGVVLPLSIPRTLGATTAVSAFKVVAILFVVGSVVFRSLGTLRSPGYPWQEVQMFQWGEGLFAALPILAFGFQCHTAVVDTWFELEDEPSLFGTAPAPGQPSHSPGGSGGEGGGSGGGSGYGMSAKQRGMTQVSVASIGVIAAFYCVIGVFGSLAFPGAVQSNIMLNFAQDDGLIQVARAMVGLMVVAAFPVNHVPARSTILGLARHVTGVRELPGSAYTLETLAFCLVATGIALEVSDLGAMFQLIGGTAAAVLIFGIPGALLLKSSYDQHTVAAANSPGRSLQQGVGEPGAGSTSLQEPLLQQEWQPDSAAQQQQRQAWRWWGCRKFWAGAALEVVTVASWGVTLYNLFVLQGP